MKIIKLFLTIYFFILFSPSKSTDNSFEEWLISFKIKAQEEGISKKTINNVLDGVVFMPKVIEYDRYQPEFYEDTITYITKRVTSSKIENGSSLYKKKN